MEGYYYGILDVYYAIMKTEDTAAAAPTYEDPEVLAKSIEVTITPAYRDAGCASERQFRHSPGWKARGHPPQMRQADRGRRGRPARIDAAGPRAAADGSAGGRGARHRAGQPAFAAGTAGPVKRH